jgi:hypothetical protein
MTWVQRLKRVFNIDICSVGRRLKQLVLTPLAKMESRLE